MQTTMLSKVIQTYVIIGVVLYLVIFLYWFNSVNPYNILNITVFLSYAYMLWICVNKEESYFTNRRLWFTVFLYSLVFVFLYLLLSYYYSGDSYVFSLIDARIYERQSFRMKDMGFLEALNYISHRADYDDWGAPMIMALILKIIPSKLFLNFCYVLMNTMTAIMLFDIGKIIGMSKKYAYIAALSNTIASYTLFMMGTFLKEEIFIMLIVLSIWCLYKYFNTTKIGYLVGGGFASFLIIFFRVPVALFIWLSYAILLLSANSSHVKKTLLMILVVSVSLLVVGLWHYSVSRYANEGDITSIDKYANSSMFQKMVGYANILIGPFPTMYHIDGMVVKARALNSAGLLFKMILFLPFWKGLILCVRSRIIILYPLYFYTLASLLGLFVVLRIDYRFAETYMPLFILVAFWFMDNYDADADESVKTTPYYYWTNMEFKVSIVIVFLVTLAWNVLIRDQSGDNFKMDHLELLLPGI